MGMSTISNPSVSSYIAVPISDVVGSYIANNS